MSNSPLVNHVRITPHSSNPRNDVIRKITIHHMAGNLSVERCGEVFQSRQASSNYGVGTDGRVGLYVDEGNRSWASSSRSNDNQAVTIEVANDSTGGDWHVSDTALEKTIDLCVDICKRNGIAQLNYTGDKNGNLTRHNYFAATLCPGPYLQSKFPYIANEVNKRLTGEAIDYNTLYKVQVGAFKEKENAETLQDELDSKEYNTYLVKENDLYKVQVGAFSNKENADKLKSKLDTEGYDTFMVETGEKEPTEAQPVKSNREVAKEVLNGKWGNGAERKTNLTNAGYDYNAVQAEVNNLLK